MKKKKNVSEKADPWHCGFIPLTGLDYTCTPKGEKGKEPEVADLNDLSLSQTSGEQSAKNS